MTGETIESMMAAIRYLAAYLVGTGIEDIAAISKRMDFAFYGNYGAKSAIEIALHDALGKAQSKPVYELLGGKRRDRAPMLRLLASSDIEADVAEGLRMKAQGYVIKIAAATDIAIGCDEGVHRPDDLRRHHDARAARGASQKTVKLGGLKSVCEAAALCEALDMKVNLAGKIAESGICSAALLHLAAAVPTLDWGVSPTSPYLVEDVIAKPLDLSNGHARVPAGIGLGIEVDEQRVRRFTIER